MVASAILITGLTGVLAAYAAYDRASSSVLASAQAAFIAEQGLEAAALLRDMSWSATIGAFATDTPYFLSADNGTWSATTTPAEIDGTFYRAVTFSAVNRDANDNIATAGSDDAHTRLVTATVSWWSAAKSATSSISLQTYLTDLFNN